MSNPYEPPQSFDSPPPQSAGSQRVSVTVFSPLPVVLWGIFGGLFCFIGRYLPNADPDVFGFGGMALFIVGQPIIAASTIRASGDYSSFKTCSLLDLLGMMTFVATVRTQMDAGYEFHHWLVLAAMAFFTIVISGLIAFLLRRFRPERLA